MATISQYIQEIDKWRDRLANILTEKGIPSDESEKLNDLVPRVGQLNGGGGSLQAPSAAIVLASLLPAPEPVIATMERMTQSFTLDTSRFDAENPVLYGTDGKEIGTASAQTGTLSSLVYTVEGGLRTNGYALLTFHVMLGSRFTLVLRYSDYALGTGQVHGFLRFSDGSLESVLDDGAGGNLFWYLVRQSGGSGQTAYNGARMQNVGSYYRYDDPTIPEADYSLYAMEQRYVCDGTYVSFYLNGILRSRESMAAFAYPTSIVIGFPSVQYAASDAFTVEQFSLTQGAQLPDGYRLYRMRITAFKGSDNYAQLSRLCLYDVGGNRLDTSDRAVAYITADGIMPTFPVASEDAQKLTGDRTGSKACWVRGSENTIYFSLPTSGGALASYSYITAGDIPARDPVSWEMQSSSDGGLTWQTIDTQTGVAITDDRNAETQRFEIA